MEDLTNIHKKENPHSAPSTPSISEKPRNTGETEESGENIQAVWETTEVFAEGSSSVVEAAGPKYFNSGESPKLPKPQKPPKKKSPNRQDSKLGMKLRTGLTRN